MSLENQTPDTNEIERNPISVNESEAVDAQGKPRSHREMPDGTMTFTSQEEYNEALESYHEAQK